MKVEPRDDVDRAIDEALALVVRGEPRRVNAASVRTAMLKSRSSRLPIWLAAAAVLIVAFAVSLRRGAPAVAPPPFVARSAETPDPLPPRTTKAPDRLPAGQAAAAAGKPSRRASAGIIGEPPYEGLPRLTIASIELPEPLFTPGLEPGTIQISRLDITPLSVSSLSHDQEQRK